MSLITRHRPKTFDELIGQPSFVKSIKGVLKERTSRAFLLIGPPGVGKTSAARLIASYVKCDSRNITEVDGASSTGIDAMRELTESMAFSAMGGGKAKFYIVDECQRVSVQAFSSLLKSIEEPPPNVWWALCTTDPQKIPKAIRTRCTEYTLNAVPKDDIFDLLVKVSKAEGFTVSEDVLYLLAEKCEGSPRQSLSFLAQCSGCKTRKEAAELLRTVEENPETIELCRFLMKGGTWAGAMALLSKLGDVDAESCRQIILSYFSKVVAGAKSENEASKGLAVIESFKNVYPSGNNRYCLLLSLGELLLQE